MFHLQPRGTYFMGPGAEVYEGMILGEHNRANDTNVNATREKVLSNVRNHGKDENILLAPPRVLTIETAMEWIDLDELVEVTPDAVRVRKLVLAESKRPTRRATAIEAIETAHQARA
jgi:GTP-binding protein